MRYVRNILAILLLPVVAFGQAYTGGFAWSNAPTLFARGTPNLVSTGNVFSAGQSITLSNSTPGAVIQVYDLRTNLIASGASPITLTPGAGWYMAQCASNGGDRIAFTVLPSGFDTPVWWADNAWRERFGTGGLIRQKWLRTQEGFWAYNTNSFSRFDAVTNCALPTMIAVADYTPTAFTNSYSVWLGGYTNYVKSLLTRAKNSGMTVIGVEPWNEPGPGKFPTDRTWQDYLTSAITNCSAIAAAIDPTWKIVAPSWSSIDSVAITASLRTNGATYSNLAYHDYDLNDYPPDQTVTIWTGTKSNRADSVRSLLTAAGLSSTTTTYVNEFGIQGQSAFISMVGTGYPGCCMPMATDYWTGYNRAIKALLLYRSAGVWLQTHELAGIVPTANPTNAANESIYGFEVTPSGNEWTSNSRGMMPKTAGFLAAMNRIRNWTSITATYAGNTWTVSGYDTNLNQTVTAQWRTEGSGTGALPAGATDVWGNTMGGLLADEVAFFRNPVGGGSGAVTQTVYITTNFVVYVTNTVTRCYSVDRYGRKKLITCP